LNTIERRAWAELLRHVAFNAYQIRRHLDFVAHPLDTDDSLDLEVEFVDQMDTSYGLGLDAPRLG
jgi:hypothetical protein